ncbi:hypothetical protein WG922_21395 [Ramlibacter sp. AN1015]|uniref:hypothetical protein n=1 Tax=Ramlibacter sp. AN1015 TaxID=3133428 RepID=UPI0030BDBE30
MNGLDNIQVESVHAWDYPDFSDAFISYAERDGVPLTDAELAELNADSSLVNEAAHATFQ